MTAEADELCARFARKINDVLPDVFDRPFKMVVASWQGTTMAVEVTLKNDGVVRAGAELSRQPTEDEFNKATMHVLEDLHAGQPFD